MTADERDLMDYLAELRHQARTAALRRALTIAALPPAPAPPTTEGHAS